MSKLEIRRVLVTSLCSGVRIAEQLIWRVVLSLGPLGGLGALLPEM